MSVLSVFLVIVLVGICVGTCVMYFSGKSPKNIKLPKIKSFSVKEGDVGNVRTKSGAKDDPDRTFDADATLTPGLSSEFNANNSEEKTYDEEMGCVVLIDRMHDRNMIELPFSVNFRTVGREELDSGNKTISRNAFAIAGDYNDEGPNKIKVKVTSEKNRFKRTRANRDRVFKYDEVFDLIIHDTLNISGNLYEVNQISYHGRKQQHAAKGIGTVERKVEREDIPTRTKINNR